MSTARLAVAVFATVFLVACRAPLRPIFPAVSSDLVWPRPPDRPRIRYVGALRGESSLGVKPRGWAALRAVLAGPRHLIDFARPSAVAVAGERIFVADIGLAVVHMLDLANRRYAVLAGAPDDPLAVPIDVTIAGGDTVVVVDRKRAALDLFDLDGHWRRTLRWAQLAAPVAADWDAGHDALWIADAAAHACFVTTGYGPPRQAFGGRGSGWGRLNYPSDLVVGAGVGVVVADAMNFRVQVFDVTGQVAAVFGQKGDAAGDFSRPRSVAVDSDGHIYVVDNQFENVQVFDRAGRLLMAFGRGGSGPGQFSLPAGITIDARDRIWIADSYNHRVQVFQYLAEEAS